MTQDNGERRYRINPDFVPREPTPADMFSFRETPETQKAFDQVRREAIDFLRNHGAKSIRVTLVDHAKWPGVNEPYPEGLWFEGWEDELANQLPFGGEHGGICWPALTPAQPQEVEDERG